MKKLFTLVLVLIPLFALCGDGLCTPDEESSCRDCSLTVQNYVCESFLPEFDPDCGNQSGCYGPDPDWYVYNNGRGELCWPGQCSSGSCTNSCSSQSDCNSGFCTNGICSEVCATGTVQASYSAACCGIFNETSGECEEFRNQNKICSQGEWEVWPIFSGIFTGDTLSLGFKIVHYCNANKTLSLLAVGPCSLSYDSSLEFNGPGTETVFVKVSNCKFEGVGSVKLAVFHDSGSVNNSAYFLSYPSILYDYGREPRRGAGEGITVSKLNSVPVEVKAWLG